MKISIAQIKPVKGDIAANIAAHISFIELAVTHHADGIFFPELSITGYEPELANKLATTQGDTRFDIFQQTADRHNISIGLGAPIRSAKGVLIGMIIFQPNQAKQTYCKQQLHEDEFPYFVSGDKQLIIQLGELKIAPAICYESLQENHAEAAHQLGAAIYIASVAKSQKGVDKAMIHYPAMAKKYAMPVMMCNCTGYCDNFEAVGKSAVWSPDGNLLAQLDEKPEGILIFDTVTAETNRASLISSNRQ